MDTTQLKSHSQNYQDIFALVCSDYKQDGTFIDIGCSYPNHFSNVVSLIKQFNWNGLGFDLKTELDWHWEDYKGNIAVYELNVVEHIDKLNKLISERFSEGVIDYLNVDIDGYPCQYAIENLDLYKHSLVKR